MGDDRDGRGGRNGVMDPRDEGYIIGSPLMDRLDALLALPVTAESRAKLSEFMREALELADEMARQRIRSIIDSE